MPSSSRQVQVRPSKMMAGRSGKRAALARIRRIVARLSEPIVFCDDLCRIGASAGVILAAQAVGAPLSHLLAHADAALYAAKRAGRGRVLLWQTGMETG